ncbi:hypothetical protein NDU88_010594 [Pleurodeles waltl]|uniref:Uncharacterized protein n=1 Tax=Pleurodeles waltl TaxID=8319 RepID=A0AAV7S1Q4_PLEWA|nr:hypothetical protein NDU88_010594 [Pleurodeles waltl]
MGRGQAGVNGGRELKKLCVSPSLSEATRGFGGWRHLVGGGAEQREANSGRPRRFHGPPSSGEKRAQTCCAERARRGEARLWKPVWRGLLKPQCPIGAEKEPGNPVGARRGGAACLPRGALRRGRGEPGSTTAWPGLLACPCLNYWAKALEAWSWCPAAWRRVVGGRHRCVRGLGCSCCCVAPPWIRKQADPARFGDLVSSWPV